jgi:hypothetical protein
MDQSAQDPALEARVGRLEVDVHDVKSTLGRLEPLIVSMHAQMPYLATKVEVEKVRTDLQAQIEGLRGEVRAGLAEKPGFLGMWMMGATLVVAGMTAGAAYLPILAHAFHAGP